MGTNTGTIMTLANSIIGVSVLAMPFCFKQCGIILSIIMLIASSLLSRLACHFLLKCAVMARRRTFEFLAFHTFGWTGKFAVEVFIIGFLMGTCIAFFVVMGDLGPAIVAKIFGASNTEALRPSVLIGLAIFVVLPLGMLKNVDSLSSVSMATIGFYICLVFKVIGESLPHLLAGDWYQHVHLWRPAGILQCIPIFSMALFCQTQLFEIYESMHNASLDRMNFVIRAACNICTGVYICVGFFGYIAFCTQQFSGNVLMSFTPSIGSEIIKLGFVLSVAVSFPLVIFPCRASLYSLLFRRPKEPVKDDKGPSIRPSPDSAITHSLHLFKITVPHHEGVGTHIPEARFKCLTVVIISVALIIGLLIPNIELVLGLVGSTIGVLICVMFPAAAFICMTSKSSNDRLLAQVLLFIGALILVLGTYATLDSTPEHAGSSNIPLNDLPSLEKSHKDNHDFPGMKLDNSIADIPPKLEQKEANVKPMKKEREEMSDLNGKLPPLKQKGKEVEIARLPNADKRQEPPVPVEPAGDVVQIPSNPSVVKESKVAVEAVKSPGGDRIINNSKEEELKRELDTKDSRNGAEQIHRDAIIKEDEELAEAEKRAPRPEESKNEEILRKLEKHDEQQKKILQKQQEILDAIQEHQERDLLLQKKEVLPKSENVSQLSDKRAPGAEQNENKLPQVKGISIQKPEEIQIQVDQNNAEAKGKVNRIENQNVLESENKMHLSEEMERKLGRTLVPTLNNIDKEPPASLKKQDLLLKIANGELKKQVVNIPPEAIVAEKVMGIVNEKDASATKGGEETKDASLPKIKESFHLSGPKVNEKELKPGPGPAAVDPLLLKRLNQQPIALQMNNNKKPLLPTAKETEDNPRNSMNNINAIRREILQESVVNTQTAIPESDENKIVERVGKEKHTRMEIQPEFHERDKRDVTEVEVQNVPGSPNESLHVASDTNMALEDQNCQLIDKGTANRMKTEPAEHHPAAVKGTEKDGVNDNRDNSFSIKQKPKTSLNETAGKYERVVSYIPSLEATLNYHNMSSFNEQNEEPKEQQLLNDDKNPANANEKPSNANVDSEIIKSSKHLSDPDMKNNNNDIQVLKQAILPPDTKPMKRDLKSILVQEEKSSDDQRQG